MFGDIINKRISKKIQKEYPEIKVLPGEAYFNRRCHLNSANIALRNNHEKVICCITIEETGSAFMHFLNIDSSGNYIENTLGQFSQIYRYYLIGEILKEDLLNIDRKFTEYRNMIRKKYIHWSYRFLIKIDFI